MPATTPILFPSGEDANPLNRRLPAEVVTRRRRETKRVEDKPSDDVQVDLKTALSLKPESRLKWLGKACKMAEEGKASSTELYSIVASRKFASGMHPKIGRKMMEVVHEHLGVFSDKQQRHLRSDDWVVIATFRERAAADPEADDQDADAAPARDPSRERSADDRRESQREDPRREERHQEPQREEPRREERRAEERRREERRADDRRRDERRQERPQADPRESQGWTEAAAASGQEDRARREALLAEERARRKAREREEQERWLTAEAENAKRRALKQQLDKKRQLEEEADSSLLALERLGQQQQQPPEEKKEKYKERRRENKSERGRSRGGLSRSRSVASVSRSRGRRSNHRGRSGSYSVSVKRDRSRRRGRRPGPRDRAAFDEALRRRMNEREANDTTRIPVVDPGHAARMLGGHR